jgi:hypothetical protein
MKNIHGLGFEPLENHSLNFKAHKSYSLSKINQNQNIIQIHN